MAKLELISSSFLLLKQSTLDLSSPSFADRNMSKLTTPRPLPWDVLHLVFSFSPPPTLAVLGGVSMDFLEATVLLLYRCVELNSLESLKLLFCSREGKSESRVDDLLSLSQIRTLSLDLSSLAFHQASLLPSLLPLSSSRRLRSNPAPLPLDLLKITVLFDSGPLLPLLYISLLPQLNPTHFGCHVRERIDTSPEFYLGGSKLPILSHFTRLQTISLHGIVPFTFQKAAPLGTYSLSCLPSPSLDRRRVLRLHLPSLLHSGCSNVGKWVRNLDRWQEVMGFSGVQEGSIVLVVETEEERKEAETAMEEVEERWKSLYVVEVERT